MKIYIRDKNGRRLFIPVPLSVAGIGCKIAAYVLEKSGNHLDNQQRDVIECIDFDKLAKSLKYLRGYRGLKLVEVTSKNGEEVTIIL